MSGFGGNNKLPPWQQQSQQRNTQQAGINSLMGQHPNVAVQLVMANQQQTQQQQQYAPMQQVFIIFLLTDLKLLKDLVLKAKLVYNFASNLVFNLVYAHL